MTQDSLPGPVRRDRDEPGDRRQGDEAESDCLVAAMGAVAAVILIVAFHNRQIHPSSSLASQARPPALQASVTTAPVPSPTSRMEDAESQQQLTAARREMSSLAATIRAQRDELEALGKVKDSLNFPA